MLAPATKPCPELATMRDRLIRLVRMVGELARVATRFSRIESVRRRVGPDAAMTVARRLGEACPERSAAGRKGLRAAIRVVDRVVIGSEPNCFRRALIEVSLDRGAAKEPLMMGFRQGGGPKSGHARLVSETHSSSQYDAVISI
jgi:hypothetical protein